MKILIRFFMVLLVVMFAPVLAVASVTGGGFASMFKPDDLLLGSCLIGGLVINAEALRDIYNAFNTRFQEAFDSVKPTWDQIAMLVPSSTATETYGWLAAIPRMREWIGERFIKDLKSIGYAITNKEYEVTIEVPATAIEDDTIGVFSPVLQEMGKEAALHPDSLLYELLEAGFAGTKGLAYDGQYFFDTDHPVGSGVVSNTQAGALASWFMFDTRLGVKPIVYQLRKAPVLLAKTDAGTSDHVFLTNKYLYGVDARYTMGYGLWRKAFGSKIALDVTNFNLARAAMRAFKDDEGRPLGVVPDLLVVGPSNEAAAKAILEAESLANGATNTNRGVMKLLVSQWLT